MCDATPSYGTWLISTWRSIRIVDGTRLISHSCVMRRLHMGHDPGRLVTIVDPTRCSTCATNHLRVTSLICVCAMTRSHVCNGSIMCVPWLIHMCAMTHSYVTWRICIYHDSFTIDMTHVLLIIFIVWYYLLLWFVIIFYHHLLSLFVRWHDAFICDRGAISAPIHTWQNPCMCATTHLYVPWLINVRHNSFISDRNTISAPSPSNLIWHIHVWHDSFIRAMIPACVTWPIHMWQKHNFGTKLYTYDMTSSCVTWLTHTWRDALMRDMTHSYVWQEYNLSTESSICDMIPSYVTWSLHVRHDSFIRAMTLSYVPWFLHMWQWLSYMWQEYNISADLQTFDKNSSCVMWLIYTWQEYNFIRDRNTISAPRSICLCRQTCVRSHG